MTFFYLRHCKIKNLRNAICSCSSSIRGSQIVNCKTKYSKSESKTNLNIIKLDISTIMQVGNLLKYNYKFCLIIFDWKIIKSRSLFNFLLMFLHKSLIISDCIIHSQGLYILRCNKKNKNNFD